MVTCHRKMTVCCSVDSFITFHFSCSSTEQNFKTWTTVSERNTRAFDRACMLEWRYVVIVTTITIFKFYIMLQTRQLSGDTSTFAYQRQYFLPIYFSLFSFRRTQVADVPFEFVTNFDPTCPMVLGGLLSSESSIGFVQVSAGIKVQSP